MALVLLMAGVTIFVLADLFSAHRATHRTHHSWGGRSALGLQRCPALRSVFVDKLHDHFSKITKYVSNLSFLVKKTFQRLLSAEKDLISEGKMPLILS